jgi:hypothetical protein
VHTTAELSAALGALKAGETVQLAPGTYTGNFTIAASGTQATPIHLCGPASAILDGGKLKTGYVVHLQAASWVQLSGFTVTDGQKGIVVDRGAHDLIDGLVVHHIGDEAIHLRTFTTASVVRNSTISDTGLDTPKFGEGVYVGSATKNWCTYSNCGPDASNGNSVLDNTIAQTTAENIDIKEGTTGGLIQGNSLSGAGMVTAGGSAWINVKGNQWTVAGNHGITSLKDGFQVHQILSGWGLNNTFGRNTAKVNGPGYGFYTQSARLDTVVTCDNTESGAAKGLSNVTCTP